MVKKLKSARLLGGSLLVIAATLFSTANNAISADYSVCLIAKQSNIFITNELKVAAQSQAAELGITLFTQTADSAEVQVQAIENCIAKGVRGILISAIDPNPISNALKTARSSGLLVLAIGDQDFEPETIDLAIAADRNAMVDAASAWAKSANSSEGKLLLSAELLPKDSGESFSQLIGEFSGNATIAPNSIERLDSPTLQRNNSTVYSYVDANKAYENAESNSIELGAMFAGPSDPIETLAEKLRGEGLNETLPVIAFDSGCLAAKALTSFRHGAIMQEDHRNAAVLGIESINEFVTQGQKPSPSEGKTFMDSGAILALPNGPEVQMPNPLCKINPKLCHVQPVSIAQFLSEKCD